MLFIRIHSFALATFLAFASVMVPAFGVTGGVAKSSEPELRRLAEGGDAYAQAVLALAYANGDKGLPLSISEAEKWARLSAAQHHPIGKFAMGYLAQSPILGLDADVPSRYYLSAFGDSKGELVKMAVSGDPVASYAIGMILTSDVLRPKLVPDMALAARHHAVASKAGFLPSILQLGIMKIENMLDEKDMEGGLDLLRQAVSGNLPVAHHYMGLVYLKGKGVPVDQGMTLVHFRKAADLGHGRSMLVAAHFYAYGMATPVDLPLARQYALRAASLREPKAEEKLLQIESLVVAGPSPTPLPSGVPEPEETDLPPAPPSPGEVSSSSPPVPPPLPTTPGPTTTIPVNPSVIPEAPSPEQSSFLPVPGQPNPPSGDLVPKMSAKTRELAKRHYSGIGVPIDYTAARGHFLIAAKAGDAEAARYLGIIYLLGKGVPKDRLVAARWLRQAAAGGDVLAKRNLELLEQLLAP